MNEQIKELWSQAGGHYNNGNQHTWPQYTIDDPKKFAELLIREFMDNLAWHGHDEAVSQLEWFKINKLGIK